MKKGSLLIVAASLTMLSGQSFANGCIVVRPTSQLSIGLDDRHESKAGTLDSTFSYRHLFSHRHFVGSEEQKQRLSQGTQVENTVDTTDYNFTYWLSNDWRLSAGIPYSVNRRTSQRDRAVGNTMNAEGIGDLRVIAYHDFLSDPEGPAGGITLGVGIKFPTGKDDTRDISIRPGGPEWRYNDQSIQLGDGGTGLILEFQGFKQFFNERNFGFVTLSYLLNPEDTNGVPTHRSNPYEQIQSIPDTYQLRTGWAHVFTPHWSLDSGLRAEGVPAEDLVGDSNGFRRPGYSVYFEPQINFQSGKHRANLSVPYAIYRTRIMSVADRKTGGHGDAAFADYLVMGSYTYSF